jgi:hypothetical protein
VSSVGAPGAAFRISDAGWETSSAFNFRQHHHLVTGRSHHSDAGRGIYGQIVSHDGAPIGDETIITTDGFPAPNGQIVYNRKADEFFAVWRDQVEENLKGQRLSGSGALLGDATVISRAFPEFDRAATVAFDPARNRYLVAFAHFQTNKLWGQFVSGAGELIGANFGLGTSDSRETPSVVYSGRHRAFVLAWRNGDDIIVRLLSTSGEPIGTVLHVTRHNKAAESPRLVANINNGQFLVVWADDRNLARGRRDIFAQRIGIQR